MKKLTHYIFVLLLATLLAACNQPAPDGVDVNEAPINISSYQGKWVVVNYWAMWCKPCLEELPELNKLYKNHKDKVMVLGVSFDVLPNDNISTFAKSLHLTFPMLTRFDLEKFGVAHVPTLPMTFLFSPKGELVKTLQDPQTEESVLKAIDN
jgi:thiol-disulfide isomerase/thioredoxin